jgi:hypothetical protein
MSTRQYSSCGGALVARKVNCSNEACHHDKLDNSAIFVETQRYRREETKFLIEVSDKLSTELYSM